MPPTAFSRGDWLSGTCDAFAADQAIGDRGTFRGLLAKLDVNQDGILDANELAVRGSRGTGQGGGGQGGGGQGCRLSLVATEKGQPCRSSGRARRKARRALQSSWIILIATTS